MTYILEQRNITMSKELKSKAGWGGNQYLPNFLQFSKKLKIYIFTSLIILILISFFVLWPLYPALTFTDGKTNRLVGVISVSSKDSFAIHYTHSIHKTPVIEKYIVDEKYNIVVDELIYESYGVGMPSSIEPGQTFRQENGTYIIGNINRALPFFDQVVGQVANHQLVIHDKTISLADLTKPGHWLRIQIQKVSLIRLWKEGAFYDKGSNRSDK